MWQAMRLNLGGYSEGPSGNAAVSDINERALAVNIRYAKYSSRLLPRGTPWKLSSSDDDLFG